MPLWIGLTALGAGCAVAWSAAWLRVLTPVAAVLAGAFAASLIAWGGLPWVLPGGAFFLGSTLVSRIGTTRKAQYADRVEKPGPRDAWQVLANGGAAWACVLSEALLANGAGTGWYAAGLGAFATAAADTWGTELGTLSARPPRSLRTGRRVPTGTSGAISLHGTAGAALGAFTVALGAWLGGGASLLPASGYTLAAGVTISGCVGMLSDGLLGATLQARYRDPDTGALTERPPSPTATPVHGCCGLHNDAVNLLGTTTGAAAAWALHAALW